MSKEKMPKLGRIELDPEFSLDLDYYLYQDYTDVSLAAAELPPIIEWVNAKLQGLTEQKIVQKQRLKEVEAAAYFSLRGGEFSDRYVEKMTESALDKAVCLDDTVKVAHRDYAVLAGWVQRLNNLQDSLQAKMDLVRTSEATRRRLVDPEAETERE